jgi:hypothetical protein
MNHFFKMWIDAVEGRSEYKPIEILWDAVPGRDEEWRKQTIANTSEEQFRQEFECVHGDTIVTVRDEETQEIHNVKIKHLYEFL